MNQLLHAMAIDKNAKPQHMRVLMYVIANGPGADLAGIPFSPQAVDSAAAHLVVKGIITRDSGRSTFSLANSKDTPEQLVPAVTPPQEPVPDEPKEIDEKDGFEWHPFLTRDWDKEQQPALKAWFDKKIKRDLCRIARGACSIDPVAASSEPRFKEALDIAERWALKAAENEEST